MLGLFSQTLFFSLIVYSYILFETMRPGLVPVLIVSFVILRSRQTPGRTNLRLSQPLLGHQMWSLGPAGFWTHHQLSSLYLFLLPGRPGSHAPVPVAALGFSPCSYGLLLWFLHPCFLLRLLSWGLSHGSHPRLGFHRTAFLDGEQPPCLIPWWCHTSTALFHLHDLETITL